jgi:hypothetical protein
MDRLRCPSLHLKRQMATLLLGMERPSLALGLGEARLLIHTALQRG